MDAKELQLENKRLKELLSATGRERQELSAALERTQQQLQLMLFSLEELQAIADELEQSSGREHPGDDGSSDSDQDDNRRQPGRSRRKKLPKNLRREIVRHELTPQERACHCCGEQRQEIGVESNVNQPCKKRSQTSKF